MAAFMAGTLVCGIAMLMAAPGAAQAAFPPYPERPIRVIVPSTPGTPPDVVSRMLAERLGGLGQPVVVENRPGAGFTIGLHAVAKATPDGYTFGTIAMPAVMAPFLLHQVPYDVIKDLAPISQVVWNSNVLVVRASSGLRSVSDLVALAKAKPGQLAFASGGSGTPAHIAGELFKLRAGIDIRHVPYKGGVAGVTAIMSDQIDLMFAAIPASAPHIHSGRLRALAIPAPRRVPAFPDLPTMAESGFPEIDVRDWQGWVAPAGTPKEIISKMGTEIAGIVRSPEIRERLVKAGMEPATDLGPSPFGALLRSENSRWGKVVREAKIRSD